MKTLIAIIGPTGIGKSRLGLSIARTYKGEIISADSRQIYRYMNIGTAKPTLQEMREVPHHLVDIINPDETFSLADFLDAAGRAVEGINAKGKLPILVGGSGQYVWAVLEGWQIPHIEPDAGLRRELESRAANEGTGNLLAEIARLDPAAAERVDCKNPRRVIRALEIALAGGKPPAVKKPLYNYLAIGLTAPREKLYEMIDQRVDTMIRNGLVEEVKWLTDKGYGPGTPSISGIGYAQIAAYLAGKTGLEEAIKQIKFESHRLVRMQYNWFSLKDERIKWYDIMQAGWMEQAAKLVERFIQEK
ncbi:MAG: tRNA (adenosine(37)-N6)-dimethylallyltransferase MiaA [Dehalococcoidaceae bacterium]|nr:tRNA (adenosine(37)-N6)-dimethylallyltransferase MiaA [Dehalococcoidaceae bacterium]